MITTWPRKVASASGVPPHTIHRLQPSLHESSQVKSPSQLPTVASWLTYVKSLSSRHAVHRLPPNTRPNSLDYGLEPRSITVSNLAPSRPPNVSPNSLNYGLQVHHQTHSIMASKCISKLVQLWPPSSHNQGLQVHIHTRSITISEYISKFTRSRPPSVSPNPLDYCLQVHLQTRSIIASECISGFTRSWFPGAARISEAPLAASPDIRCVDG